MALTTRKLNPGVEFAGG
ncbi:MAG: hypothetical protein ACKPGT_29615 [Microcystis sp.]